VEQRDGNQGETLKSFKEGSSVFLVFPHSLYWGVVDGAVRSLEFDSCGGFPDLLVVVESISYSMF
jgi:hypothetical protein